MSSTCMKIIFVLEVCPCTKLEWDVPMCLLMLMLAVSMSKTINMNYQAANNLSQCFHICFCAWCTMLLCFVYCLFVYNYFRASDYGQILISFFFFTPTACCRMHPRCIHMHFIFKLYDFPKIQDFGLVIQHYSCLDVIQ